MQPKTHRRPIKRLHIRKAFAEDQPGQFLASQDIVKERDSWEVSSFSSSSPEEANTQSTLPSAQLIRYDSKFCKLPSHKRAISELPTSYSTQDILTTLTHSTQDPSHFRKQAKNAKDDVFGLDRSRNNRLPPYLAREANFKAIDNCEASDSEALIRKIIQEKKEGKCADAHNRVEKQQSSSCDNRSNSSKKSSFVELQAGMEKILYCQERELKKQTEKRNELKKQLLDLISKHEENLRDGIDFQSMDRVTNLSYHNSSFASTSTHNGPGSTFLLYDTLDGFDRVPEFPPEFFMTHDRDRSISGQRVTENTKVIEDEVAFLKKSLQILNEKIRNDNVLKPPPNNRKVISYLLSNYLEGDILEEVLQVFNTCRYTDQFVLALENREFAGLYERDEKRLTKLVGVSGTPNIIEKDMIQRCYKYSIDKTALKLIENSLGECDVVTIELCNI